MFGKHLNCAKLEKHIAKLRNKNEFWKLAGSQAVQDICQRIDEAYKLFFKHHSKGVRPPSFKKIKKYKSFTLKQARYKFLGGNRIRIGKRVYQFWKSQEITGTVKTVTVKRTPLGELFLAVVVDGNDEPLIKTKSGKMAGFDFGLKTFLTVSDGTKIESPEFFKASLKAVQNASRELSRKVKGSKATERSRNNLCRRYEDISNRRTDWFWKLAHELTDRYDVLIFEDLNLKAMQRLWGRKVNDLAFGEFLQILQWVAKKKNKIVHFIDRFYPSSKTCSNCQHVLESLDLSVRSWRCPNCSKLNDRDQNASENILSVGASTLGLGDVSRALPAIPA